MARDFANDVVSVRTFNSEGIEYCEVVFPIKPEEYANAKGTKLFALDSRVPAAGNDNLVRHFPTPFGQAYLTNLTVKALDTKGTAQDLTKLTKDQLVKLLLQQQGLPVGEDTDANEDLPVDDASDGVAADVTLTLKSGTKTVNLALSEEQVSGLFGRGKRATTRINEVAKFICAAFGLREDLHTNKSIQKASEKFIADTALEAK